MEGRWYNILKCNQADTTPQDRLAAAFGGLKSMLAITFSREIPWGWIATVSLAK
jgi:hypothetical protein